MFLLPVASTEGLLCSSAGGWSGPEAGPKTVFSLRSGIPAGVFVS